MDSGYKWHVLAKLSIVRMRDMKIIYSQCFKFLAVFSNLIISKEAEPWYAALMRNHRKAIAERRNVNRDHYRQFSLPSFSSFHVYTVAPIL